MTCVHAYLNSCLCPLLAYNVAVKSMGSILSQQAFSVGLTLYYRRRYGCRTVSVWLDMKVFLTTNSASELTLEWNIVVTPYLYIVSLSESDLTLTQVPSLDYGFISCEIKNVAVTSDSNVAQPLSGGWK